MNGCRSRWFRIKRRGPQGSSLTPSVFITYHSDLSDAVPAAMSFLFADDVAATIAGQMGLKYTTQCIDLERRLAKFFADLEYYSILAVQPINWTKKYKYLGYWIANKLGWSTLIDQSLMKIRQRTALVNSIRFSGMSCWSVRRTLFASFVSPLFSWLFALVPLFTIRQQAELSKRYSTCLKRVYRCLYWEHLIFSALYNEGSLARNCAKYWEKYCVALSNSEDGQLLLEQVEVGAHRTH